MGNPATWLSAGVSTGFGFIQSWKEQEAIREDAKNQMDEATRQQKEANLRAQEERSDRARQADKQFASAMVAMEAIGGAGSQNEKRAGDEISGHAGIDLARIEGNRRRQVDALQAAKNATKKSAVRGIKQSQANFFELQNKNFGMAFGGGTADTPSSAGSGTGLGTGSYTSTDFSTRTNTKSGLIGGGV